ncbi:hypothetical protein BKA93DRAFT_803940 [Sparassis latifolia]
MREWRVDKGMFPVGRGLLLAEVRCPSELQEDGRATGYSSIQRHLATSVNTDPVDMGAFHDLIRWFIWARHGLTLMHEYTFHLQDSCRSNSHADVFP